VVATSELRLRIQCVLDGQRFEDVERLVGALAASARYLDTRRSGVRTHLVFGDCSEVPLDESALASLRRTAGASIDDLEYEFFDADLGSAAGTDRLAHQAPADFLLVLRPDAYPSPSVLAGLLGVFDDPSVGCADPRQIPVEPTNEYDVSTGDTSCASGSCLMVRMDVFQAVGGFAADHVSRSGAGVDFAGRVRSAGFRVVHAPSAVVFHDERIDPTGAVRSAATGAELVDGRPGRCRL
jgi:GT2 family glycosyltransferase